MIDVYNLSCQLSMKRLEMLVIKYLEAHINLHNVLQSLTYSSQLNLSFIKVTAVEWSQLLLSME